MNKFIWRRSYDVLPPAMDRDDDTQHTDRRYASLDDSVIQITENLKVLWNVPFYSGKDKITPALKDSKAVFVEHSSFQFVLLLNTSNNCRMTGNMDVEILTSHH